MKDEDDMPVNRGLREKTAMMEDVIEVLRRHRDEIPKNTLVLIIMDLFALARQRGAWGKTEGPQGIERGIGNMLSRAGFTNEEIIASGLADEGWLRWYRRTHDDPGDSPEIIRAKQWAYAAAPPPVRRGGRRRRLVK